VWLMACAIQPSVTPCLGVIVNALPSLSLTMKLYPNLVRVPSSPSSNCLTTPKPATTVRCNQLQYLATATSCNTPQVVHKGSPGISIRKITYRHIQTYRPSSERLSQLPARHFGNSEADKLVMQANVNCERKTYCLSKPMSIWNR